MLILVGRKRACGLQCKVWSGLLGCCMVSEQEGKGVKMMYLNHSCTLRDYVIGVRVRAYV